MTNEIEARGWLAWLLGLNSQLGDEIPLRDAASKTFRWCIKLATAAPESSAPYLSCMASHQ